MKYLKLFEKYLDPTNEILCDIEDICLELKDEGFGCTIQKIKHYKSNSYRLFIDKHLHYNPDGSRDYIQFTYKSVKETIDRIINYVVVDKVIIYKHNGETKKINLRSLPNDNHTLRSDTKIESLVIQFKPELLK